MGLKHFITFFESYQAMRVIFNTIRLSFYGLIVGFPLAIVFALQLNLVRNIRFKKFAQTLTYIPHFISTTVIVGMIFQVFSSVSGLYGNTMKLITGSLPPDIFGKASNFPHIYVWSGLWQGLGWSSIIYMAALAGVDPQLHEAAEIDGANRFQRLRYIDLPSILPTAAVLLILNSGEIMSVGFEKAYLLQNSMNTSYAEVISTYIYKVGLNSVSSFSYGTAVGLFNSIVNCMILVAVNFLARKLSDSQTSLW
ncbi:MAG: ABC transporter permease subunit [Clostridiaceae bacterium]|nr:ABC transporter permease subunit [Clostridiaceae bacterium]